MAMTLVSTVTVGSGGAASIEFTNIPQTGKDLLLLGSMRGDDANYRALMYLQFNGSTSTYGNKYLFGTGSSAGSGQNNAYPLVVATGTTTTSNTFSNNAIYISNYTSSVAKSVSIDSVGENNATDSWQDIHAGSWSGTSAITSVKIFRSEFNLLQHSSVSLYIIS